MVALLLRGMQKPESGDVTRAPEPPRESWMDAGGNIAVATEDDERDGDEDDDAQDRDAGHVMAVTSDGYALVPDRHAVRPVPPGEKGEERWEERRVGKE